MTTQPPYCCVCRSTRHCVNECAVNLLGWLLFLAVVLVIAIAAGAASVGVWP